MQFFNDFTAVEWQPTLSDVSDLMPDIESGDRNPAPRYFSETRTPPELSGGVARRQKPPHTQ